MVRTPRMVVFSVRLDMRPISLLIMRMVQSLPDSSSISANGTSVTNGTLSWSAPSLPEGVASWDSIQVKGTWSWTGRGGISYVKINNVNTTTGVAFDIGITGKTSPLAISCAGSNKNATGNSFTWSGLQVVYTYTEPVSQGPVQKLKVLYNGQLRTVSRIQRLSGGSLVDADFAEFAEDALAYAISKKGLF